MCRTWRICDRGAQEGQAGEAGDGCHDEELRADEEEQDDDHEEDELGNLHCILFEA